MLNSKIFFGLLLVVLVGAIALITMLEPPSSKDAPAAPANQPAAVVDDGLPRADVSLADKPVGLDIGDRAPQWTLLDPQGRSHTLSEYRGQVVVMDFWATWCGPCRKVMPDLQKLHEQYESRGVRVLGMNGSERTGNPVQFMSANNYTYPIMLNSEKIMGQYNVRGIPAIYVIGVDGTILFKHVGYVPNMKSKLADVIEPHLQRHGL